jgi:hypothetical protein
MPPALKGVKMGDAGGGIIPALLKDLNLTFSTFPLIIWKCSPSPVSNSAKAAAAVTV